MLKKLFTSLMIFTLSYICIQNQAMADNTKTTSSESTQVAIQPVDYSNKSNWMYIDTSAKHKVDLLYVYPTATMKATPGCDYGAINNQNRKSAQFAFAKSGAAFSSYTNVFAPYYRQVPATKLPNTSLDDVKK